MAHREGDAHRPRHVLRQAEVDEHGLAAAALDHEVARVRVGIEDAVDEDLLREGGADVLHVGLG